MAATDFGCDERFMRLLKLDASLPGHPTSQQSSRLSIRAPRAGKVHALPHIFCHVATVNPSDLHLLYLATRTTHPIRGVVAAFMPYALSLSSLVPQLPQLGVLSLSSGSVPQSGSLSHSSSSSGSCPSVGSVPQYRATRVGHLCSVPRVGCLARVRPRVLRSRGVHQHSLIKFLATHRDF